MHSAAVADGPPGQGSSAATTTVYTSCLWLLDSMCDQEEHSPLRQPLKSLAAAAAEAAASSTGGSIAGSEAAATAPACSDGAHLIAQGSSQEIQAWSSRQAVTKRPAAAPEPGSPFITSKLHPASSAPSHLPCQPQQGQQLRAPGKGLGQLRGISAQLRRLSEQLPQVLEAASQRIAAHVAPAAGSGAPPAAAAAGPQQAPPLEGKLQGFGSRLRRFSERLPQVLEAGSQRISAARMGSSCTSAGVEAEQASGLQRLGARLRRYSEHMLMPAAAAAPPGDSSQPAGTELRELRGHRPAEQAALPAWQPQPVAAAASGRAVDIHVYAGCLANLQQPTALQETGNTCASAPFVLPPSTAASQAQHWQGLPGPRSSDDHHSNGQLLPPTTVMLGAAGPSSGSLAGPEPAAQPAAAAAPEASESADVLELVVESSGEVEGGSSLQTATSIGRRDAYVSPAHLIAPAPPALPCTPAPDLASQAAPATITSPVSPAASDISTASGGSEALCEEASPPPPALEQQEQEQQHGVEVQEGTAVQQAPAVQQEEVPAPLPEHSGLSSLSASSGGGCYSLEAAGGAGRAPSASPASSCSGSPEEAAPAGTSWQRAREKGHVRRSLAHPIFGLQPARGVHEQAEEGQWQQQQQQQREGRPPSLAGLKALAAAQRRWSPSDSPAASPTSGKAWTLSASHIQVDLAAAAGTAPPTHRSGPQLLAAIEQWQRQQAASAIGTAAAGQYASMLQQTEQLNMSRARRAVRASLKVEKRAEAAAAATAATPVRSLFGRVVARCLRRADGPRKLRRALKRQRVHLLCLGRVPYNPDEPLHFQLWQAVCRAFAGWDASASLKRDPTLAAWQVLGFSAANPAAELADTGVLCLLLLLLLADRSPQLAAEVLAASAAALNGAPLAAAAVATTGWTLRLLRSGELAAEAQRLESTYTAAEFFFLSCMDSFLQELRQASPQVLRLPPARALMALLALAEERACGDVHAAVLRGQELAG